MKTRNKIVIAVCSLCLSIACVGFGVNQISVSAQTEQITLETHGASVRTTAPAGLRFISSVSKSLKDNGTFGTLIIPEEVLGEETLNHNLDTVDTVTLDYSDIKQTKWSTEAVKDIPNFNFDENREYFNAVMTEIPEEYYGTKLVATAYALIDGMYYYSAPVTRSIGWVAAAALADGETGDFLVECVDKALTDSTLTMEQNLLMDTDDTYTLNLNGCKDYAVIWTTSNADVVTVDNGKVTAVAEGSSIITAKLGSKIATCTVSVKEMIEGDTVLSFTADKYASQIDANLYSSKQEGHGTLAYSTDYVVAGQNGSVKLTSNSFYTDFKLLDGGSLLSYENVSFAIYNANAEVHTFFSYQGGRKSITLPANEWTVISYDTETIPVLRETTLRLFKDANYGSIVGNTFYITDFVASGTNANTNLSKVVDFTANSIGMTTSQGMITYESNGDVLNYTSNNSNPFVFDLTFSNDIQLGEYKTLYFVINAKYNGKNENGEESSANRLLKTYTGYNGYDGEKDFALTKNVWTIAKVDLKAGAVLKGDKIRFYASNWGKLNGETFYIADIYGEKYDTLIDFTADHFGFTSTQGSLTYDTTMTYGNQSGVLNYTTNNNNNFVFDLTFTDAIDLTGYTSIRFIVYAKYNGVNESGASGTSQRNLKTYTAYNNYDAEKDFALTKDAWTVVDVNIKDGAVLKGNKIRFYSSNWGKWNGETFYIADIMGIK